MMNVGDYVIVPDDNKRDVYFGEITSSYMYDPQVDKPNDGFYPHQRKVSGFSIKSRFYGANCRTNLEDPYDIREQLLILQSIVPLLKV